MFPDLQTFDSCDLKIVIFQKILTANFDSPSLSTLTIGDREQILDGGGSPVVSRV